MTQDGDANFLICALSDGFTDEVADAEALGNGAVALDGVLENLLGNLYAFGKGDDGELLAEDVALVDVGADVLDGEGNFGNENDVSAAGDSGVQGNPSGVASHDFDDHDAMVRLGGGVDAVDGIGCDVDGGVEAEGDIGGGEVVVDGLGDADDGQTFLGQIEADLLGAIATDDDEGVEAHGLGVVNDFIGEIADGFVSIVVHAIGEGVAAIGGSEDGSAARQNAAHIVEQQGAAFFGKDESVEAVTNADYLVSILEDGSFYGGPDDCVEARTVSSAGTDSNFSDL